MACFVFASISLSVHSFKHQNSHDNVVLDVTKNDADDGKKGGHHCLICLTANFFHHYLSFHAQIQLVLLTLSFLVWRKFDSVKSAFLKNSLSRAPPAIS